MYLKSYYGYAVPPGYNAFRQELWDYIIALTGSTDWRLEIDQWGKNEEIPILFIYDGGNKSFSYKCLWDEKTYSINAEEMPEVYKENPSKFFYDTTDFYGRSVAYLK